MSPLGSLSFLTPLTSAAPGWTIILLLLPMVVSSRKQEQMWTFWDVTPLD